ncbi:MAG TPA: hypothetical protein VIJ82_33175 [Streptosporangiaceae bacterium]|jgi:hypothetical protein
MILTDFQPGSGSQWTPDGLLRGHSLVAPAWNLPALASRRAADEQEDAGHAPGNTVTWGWRRVLVHLAAAAAPG